MTALPFQWMTLIGSVILIPLIVVVWRARLMVWQLAALLMFIAAMYVAFYVWLFWFAIPREYAWISAAMRAVEVAVAIGALSAVVWVNKKQVLESWKLY